MEDLIKLLTSREFRRNREAHQVEKFQSKIIPVTVMIGGNKTTINLDPDKDFVRITFNGVEYRVPSGLRFQTVTTQAGTFIVGAIPSASAPFMKVASNLISAGVKSRGIPPGPLVQYVEEVLPPSKTSLTGLSEAEKAAEAQKAWARRVFGDIAVPVENLMKLFEETTRSLLYSRLSTAYFPIPGCNQNITAAKSRSDAISHNEAAIKAIVGWYLDVITGAVNDAIATVTAMVRAGPRVVQDINMIIDATTNALNEKLAAGTLTDADLQLASQEISAIIKQNPSILGGAGAFPAFNVRFYKGSDGRIRSSLDITYDPQAAVPTTSPEKASFLPGNIMERWQARLKEFNDYAELLLSHIANQKALGITSTGPATRIEVLQTAQREGKTVMQITDQLMAEFDYKKIQAAVDAARSSDWYKVAPAWLRTRIDDVANMLKMIYYLPRVELDVIGPEFATGPSDVLPA